MWRLSTRTHCNTIYLLSACEPMEVIIQRRFINFANSIHNNEVLSTIANVAKNNPFSTFGYNYANSITNHINEWHSNIMPEEIIYIDIIRELIEVRDGRQVIAGLDRTELLGPRVIRVRLFVYRLVHTSHVFYFLVFFHVLCSTCCVKICFVPLLCD